VTVMPEVKTDPNLPVSPQYDALQPELKLHLVFDMAHYNECLQAKTGAVVFLKKSIREAAGYLDKLYASGFPISQLVTARAWFIDQVLLSLWRQCSLDETEGLALLAVGGYGRAELLPHSDIDLLVLMNNDLQLADVSTRIEQFVTLLFDTNLDIGHSVRNISECLERATEDITIATNLLETRCLAGNESLRVKLSKLAYSDQSWTDRDFFAAKRDEQLGRHEKYGDTDYNLEPNVKTSPGTLRDIQTIGWITKRHFGFRGGDKETGYEFLTDDEITVLREGETFLWQLRYGLQMIAGRNENRLLFDHQRTLANLLNYRDTDKTLGVEQMMQRYYRNTLLLRELNDVVLQYYDEVILHADQPLQPTPLNRRFQVTNHYIEAINNGVFAYQPFALLEIFLLMAQNPDIAGIRASTIRSIRAHRQLINQEFRSDLANTTIFMEILRTPHALHKTLSAMKRYGILGQYLPEFGRIIGKMQYDLFHVYTVDTHTERVVKHMINLQIPGSNPNCPLASTLACQLPKIELLYIAGLYHDIGKGRGGNHSLLGAKDVTDFCQRHHLSSRDTSLVAWLVENHLLMSVTAQKKDISDPDIIHEFANDIDTQVHLDYLYTLTVADINATNPKLWNNWRAALLRQLYNETKRVLRKGLEAPPDRQRWIKETQTEVKELLLGKGLEQKAIDQLWKNLDDDYFLQDSTREIARQTALILRHQENKPLVKVRNAREGQAKGFLQILIYQPSRPGQFAIITATLEQLNLNIHDARVSSFPNNCSLSNYVVSSTDPDAETAPTKDKIKKELVKQLEDPDRPAIVTRRTSRQLKHFSFPTEVLISFDTGRQKTMLEVISPDRPGLLARIASVFLENHVGLVKARIATLGERVEDVFTITDSAGLPLNDPILCQKLRDDICEQLDLQNQA
jgi:[protein-PII] uridylyltransferase